MKKLVVVCTVLILAAAAVPAQQSHQSHYRNTAALREEITVVDAAPAKPDDSLLLYFCRTPEFDTPQCRGEGVFVGHARIQPLEDGRVRCQVDTIDMLWHDTNSGRWSRVTGLRSIPFRDINGNIWKDKAGQVWSIGSTFTIKPETLEALIDAIPDYAGEERMVSRAHANSLYALRRPEAAQPHLQAREQPARDGVPTQEPALPEKSAAPRRKQVPPRLRAKIDTITFRRDFLGTEDDKANEETYDFWRITFEDESWGYISECDCGSWDVFPDEDTYLGQVETIEKAIMKLYQAHHPDADFSKTHIREVKQ
jgi:hypothetical protein